MLMFCVGVAAFFIERKWGSSGFSEYTGKLFLKFQKESGDKTAEKKSTILLKIPDKVYLRMVPKTGWGEWLTKMGWGRAPKVGIQKIDELFYVATENQILLKKLRDDSSLQDSLVKLHSLGFETIKSNGGGKLVIEGKSSRTGGPGPEGCLAELASLKQLCEEGSRSSDPKAPYLVALQAAFYGISFYGLASVGSYLIDNGSTHIDFYDHFLKGVCTIFCLIMSWVLGLFILLRGSSWISLVFKELTVPFFLVACLAGAHLFGDLNRVLDTNPPEMNFARIQRKYTDNSSNRENVKYFLELMFEANPFGISEDLLVSMLVYQSVEPGQNLEISIKHGFFNCPYISGLSIRPAL